MIQEHLELGEQHLGEADPLMARLIERVSYTEGGSQLRSSWSESRPPLEALLRAIIAQQITSAAARTVFARFMELFDSNVLTAQSVLRMPEEVLRAAGVSAPKARFLYSVCRAIESRELELERLVHLADDEVMRALMSVKGIGRWTAEIYLIFHLHRPDVLPSADIGIQKGLQVAYGLPVRPAAREVARTGERWRPYRTVASRYLWAAVNLKLSAEHEFFHRE